MRVCEEGREQRWEVAGMALTVRNTCVAPEHEDTGVTQGLPLPLPSPCEGAGGKERQHRALTVPLPSHQQRAGRKGWPRRILTGALSAALLAQPTFAGEGCPWEEAIVRAHDWTMEAPASPFYTAPLRLGTDLAPAREPPARPAADEAWRTLSPGMRGVRL